MKIKLIESPVVDITSSPEYKLKPTLREPTSMGKAVDGDYKKQTMMKQNYVHNDSKLSEEEKAQKKKIFKLSKMESLVHSDDKLSRIFNKIAQDNPEDKYGYHWNEAVINTIFQDYVLNNPRYMEKYKNAVPKKKKRRDKTGINQLIKKGEENMENTNTSEKPKTPEQTSDVDSEVNEIFGSLFNGSFDTSKFERKPDEVQPNDLFVFDAGSKKLIDIIPRERFQDVKTKYGDLYNQELIKISTPKNDYDIRDLKQMFKLPPIKFLSKFNPLGEDVDDSSKQWSGQWNTKQVKETTGAASSGSFAAPMPLVNKKVDETTTSASSGQYSTPVAFSKNAKKGRFFSRPIWDGGIVIGENADYITNPKSFRDYVVLMEAVLEVEALSEYSEFKNDIEKKSYLQTLNSLFKMYSEKLSSLGDEYREHFNNLLTDIEDEIRRVDGNNSGEVKEEKFDKNFVGGMKDDLINSGKSANSINKMSPEELETKDGMFKNDDESKEYGKVQGEVDLDEHHLHSKQDKIDFILQNPNGSKYTNDQLAAMSDDQIDSIYVSSEKSIGIDEKAVSKSQQKFMGMVHAVQKGKLDPSKVSDDVLNAADSMKDSDVNDFASTKHKGLPNHVKKENMEENYKSIIAKRLNESKESKKSIKSIKDMTNEEKLSQFKKIYESMIDADPISMSMAADHEDSMKNDPEDQVGETPFPEMNETTNEFFQITTPLGSNDDKMFINVINKGIDSNLEGFTKSKFSQKNGRRILDFHITELPILLRRLRELGNDEADMWADDIENESNNVNSLNEERKTNSMMNLERIKSQNAANTASDNKKEDALDDKKVYKFARPDDMRKAPVYPIPDEFYIEQDNDKVQDDMTSFAEIEKEKLAQGGFKDNALDNVGDAVREKDYIPKRNATEEEKKKIMLNRGFGMQDIVYDNKPAQKFEDRMKADMGDDIYKNRQEKMEFRGEAPMYNKDTQPTEKGDIKVNDNKFDKKYNTESVTAVYIDSLGKRKFKDFSLSEAKVILASVLDESFSKLDLNGFGNIYTQKVKLDEGFKNEIDNNEFYVKGNEVYKLKKSESKVINEGLAKMKHLMNYNPSKFVGK